MGTYPDHKTYQALYRKYYNRRDVVELLNLLEPLEGTRFLDLCGGDGRLALSALAREAGEAVLVEQTVRMTPTDIEKSIEVHNSSTESFLDFAWMADVYFDRIGCRQGVNYWLTPETAKLTAYILNPGGIFAFNTFNQKPPKKPRTVQYELEEQAFAEVSWLVGNTVHHMQVREGLPPHHTSFKWISPEDFPEML